MARQKEMERKGKYKNQEEKQIVFRRQFIFESHVFIDASDSRGTISPLKADYVRPLVARGNYFKTVV